VTIHVWTPHGQDSQFNISQVENGPLISRLVHFSYILAGYSLYRAFHWLGMTAVQALAIVSVASLAVCGFSVFRIGLYRGGRRLGWALSFLVLPLPLVLEQAQGQEYQPFATAMMLLAWYLWIARKPLLTSSIAWAASVLANPANAFLFPSFFTFSLLESDSVKGALLRSARLWVVSALVVLAVWSPFREELLFSSSWGVVPVMSAGLFSRLELVRGLAFLAYAGAVNYFIFVFALPLTTIYRRIEELLKRRDERLHPGRLASVGLSILVSVSILSITVGTATHGRYYTPLLLWLALLLLLGIYRLLPRADVRGVLTRWQWVGLAQLLFVVCVLILPYKYKAYARYHDYHMIADEYGGYVVANTGSLSFSRIDSVEHRLQRTYDLDESSGRDVSELRDMVDSGRVERFIFAFGIDVPDRALLKNVLPEGMMRALGVSPGDAEVLLKQKGLNVELHQLNTASEGVFLARSVCVASGDKAGIRQ